ncbi:hypothetical protein JCM11641_006427 [Rhodosporidiobolus odoratus]
MLVLLLLLLGAFLLGALATQTVPFLFSRLTSSSTSSPLKPDHRLYNHPTTQLLNLDLTPPATRWFNKGYWSTSLTQSDSFPQAAQQLCHQVAKAARLQPGHTVLEAGSGAGDSALFFANSCDYAPLKEYVGVTALASQNSIAEQRARQAGLAPSHFRFLRGDASNLCAPSFSFQPESFDAILAVDCAYHFCPRSQFFSTAHTLLRSPTPSTPSSSGSSSPPAPSNGGRLALTDLLLPIPTSSSSSSFSSSSSSISNPFTSLLDHLLLRLLCLLSSIPFKNLQTPSAYHARLENQGYEDIELVDISDQVWPGFIRWVVRRDDEFGGNLGGGGGGGGGEWRMLVVYATWIVGWYSGYGRDGKGDGEKRGKLRMYLISARKGGSPDGDSKGRKER